METAEEAMRREAIRPFFRNQERVDNMSAEQVTAIYLRLQTQGKLR